MGELIWTGSCDSTSIDHICAKAGAATLLTTIVSVDPIYVYADMDENVLLKFYALNQAGKLVKNGDGKIRVELQLGDEPSLSRQGHIESIDNRLDPQSCSIVVRAVFIPLSLTHENGGIANSKDVQ